jgi:negative regulator of sigma E activity
MLPPDELDEYLRGGSALSRQYRKASAPLPPPALERRVLQAAAAQVAAPDAAPGDARDAHAKPPYLAPLAFAASVLLSVAVVLAIVFGPQPAKHRNEAPRLVRTAAHAGLASNAPLGRKLELYSSDPPRARTAAQWLADIEALRRAGRNSEADAELRGFRRAYPDHAGSERKLLP